MSFAQCARGRLSLACLALLSAAACQSSKPVSPSASLNTISPTAQEPVAASDLVSPQPIPMDQIPTPAADASSASMQQASMQAAPLSTATPSDAMSVSPASMTTTLDTGSSLESRYTIKPGDTLYRIAVTHYGSGKDWRKIADANPGLSPTKLKAGQTIVLP
jgi:5'-nucleotidase/UDP-sugar diphosphatase